MASVPAVPTYDDWAFELVNLSDGTFTSLDSNSIIKVAGWVNQGATAHRLESAQLELSANSPGAAAIDWDAIQLLRIVPYTDTAHELWGYILKDKERYTERGLRDAVSLNVVPVEYLLHSRIVYETDNSAVEPAAIVVNVPPNNTGGDFAKEIVAKCMLGRFPTGVAADARAWSFATLAVPGLVHDGTVVPAGYSVFEGYLDELIDNLAREYAFVWELRPTVAAGVITFTFDTDDAGATDKTSGANKIIINDIGAMVPGAERYFDRAEMVNALHNRGISTAVLNAASITALGRWESQSNDVLANDLAIALEKLDVKEGSTFDFEATATAGQVNWMGDLPGGYEAGDLVLRNNIRLGISSNSEVINGIGWSFPKRVLKLEIRWGNKEPGEKKKRRGGKYQPAADVIPGFAEPTITFDNTFAEGTGLKVIRQDCTLKLEFRTPGAIDVAPVADANPGNRLDFINGTNISIVGNAAAGSITINGTGAAGASFVAPAFTFGAANVIGATGDVVHSDSIIALGITCDDANTVYPDAADNNEWDILGGTGSQTVGAVANTVTIDTVWVRDDLRTGTGGPTGLHPTDMSGVFTDPVLIGAGTTDSGNWVNVGNNTKLDVAGLVRVLRSVYATTGSLALWGMDGLIAKVHIVDETKGVGGTGGSACVLDVFDADTARFRVNTDTATTGFCHNEWTYRTTAGLDTIYLNTGDNGGATFNIQQAAAGDFQVESSGVTHMLFVDAGADAVGIGEATPVQPLEMYPDQDRFAILGRASIGFDGATADNATFAHVDMNALTSLALRQNATGTTVLNAANTKEIHHRINDASRMVMSATETKYYSGQDQVMFSDAGSTEEGRWDGATGAIFCAPDDDHFSTLGRASIGFDGATADNASFAHVDHNSLSSLALRQNSSGITVLNAANTRSIYIRVNNITYDQILATETVINQGGLASHDFRAESQNNTHCLFVDAGADQVVVNDDGNATGDLRCESTNHAFSFGHVAADDTEYHNAINYLFPAGDGAAGAVLSTNGAGNLTWVAAGAPPATPWTDTGVFLHPTAARNVHGRAAGVTWILTSATGSGAFAGDQDVTSFMGRAAIGYNGTTADAATFAHFDHNSPTGQGVRQASSGDLTLNAPTGHNIYHRINNTIYVWMNATTFQHRSGQDIIMYSDAGVTEEGRWDGATGNIQVGWGNASGRISFVDANSYIDDNAVFLEVATDSPAIMLSPAGANEAYCTATAFAPNVTSGLTCGEVGNVWANVYSVLGNYSGQVTVSEAVVSPFAITSTVVCTNLNADLLDGRHASVASVANTIVQRSAAQDIATVTLTATGAISGLSLGITNNITVGGTVDTVDIANHTHNYQLATSTGDFTTGAPTTWNTGGIGANTSCTFPGTTSCGFEVRGRIGAGAETWLFLAIANVPHWHDNADDAWTYAATASGIPN